MKRRRRGRGAARRLPLPPAAQRRAGSLGDRTPDGASQVLVYRPWFPRAAARSRRPHRRSRAAPRQRARAMIVGLRTSPLLESARAADCGGRQAAPRRAAEAVWTVRVHSRKPAEPTVRAAAMPRTAMRATAWHAPACLPPHAHVGHGAAAAPSLRGVTAAAPPSATLTAVATLGLASAAHRAGTVTVSCAARLAAAWTARCRRSAPSLPRGGGS